MIDVRNEVIVQSANLYLAVRKVLLSSLGAMSLTADETNEFLNRLVERGEIAEADAQSSSLNCALRDANAREKPKKLAKR